MQSAPCSYLLQRMILKLPIASGSVVETSSVSSSSVRLSASGSLVGVSVSVSSAFSDGCTIQDATHRATPWSETMAATVGTIRMVRATQAGGHVDRRVTVSPGAHSGAGGRGESAVVDTARGVLRSSRSKPFVGRKFDAAASNKSRSPATSCPWALARELARRRADSSGRAEVRRRDHVGAPRISLTDAFRGHDLLAARGVPVQ